MDERAKVFIVTGSVLFLILAIILGAVFYFKKGFKNGRQNTQSVTQNNQSPSPEASPGVETPKNTPVATGLKTFQGQGFLLSYPKGWGILTCSNSKNIELDPLNSTDIYNVSCDRAQKAITVLLGGDNCKGEKVDIGGIHVVRSKITEDGYTRYRWCVLKPSLDITHRVSTESDPATSKEDFSKQVEEMIAKLK